jgi:CRP-like cAMP-binding protein/Fe-S-cluster-containing hydrogenase component 2/thioredoxin reductase
MPSENYKIAIVGSGPAGLSAAGRAAEMGVSHILLESTPHLANTIYLYQKKKFVMAFPPSEIIPLRSSLRFDQGSREKVLSEWEGDARRLGINLRFGAEVKAIEGTQGGFTLALASGDPVRAERVVLAIGKGNLNKLGIAGDGLPFVQYQLDDPEEYADEIIVVIGAGDSAIENAVALAQQNKVIIVNRRDEFARAKSANITQIKNAIDSGKIQCLYSTVPVRVDDQGEGGDGRRGSFVLKGPEGEMTVPCDRIIARLGASAPRRFLESIGIKFPSKDPGALPEVSASYESNVPGLHIIGALAGCPLIKQAMNQGYEVVEHIEGRPVEPADEKALRVNLDVPARFPSVDEAIRCVCGNSPLLAGLPPAQLREFLLYSEKLRAFAPGDVIFKRNDYSDSFYSVIRGSVEIQADPKNPSQTVPMTAGHFFGEASLISGRRRPYTVTAGRDCLLLETPRSQMTKLINSVASVKATIDRAFLRWAIQSQMGFRLPPDGLDSLIETARTQAYDANQAILKEGDPADSLHLIRKGSVTVSRSIGGRDHVLAYVAAGGYFGEMSVLKEGPVNATVRATIATETIRLDPEVFKALLQKNPGVHLLLQMAAFKKIYAGVKDMTSGQDSPDVVSFLVGQGLGEATDVLLIDESLCVRCDNCEKACAETHQGISRLNREAGPTYAYIHVPTSCRHCEHPHCMKDCPPDAIHRGPNGEVVIDDSCIGCGNCKEYCPYGVIQIAEQKPMEPPGLLSWLLFGKGRAPGDSPAKGHSADGAHPQKKAVKCDMCEGLPGGSACVRACPTGAAIRVSPQEFMERSRGERSHLD